MSNNNQPLSEEEIKPLTEEEIEQQIWLVPEEENEQLVFEEIAKWAKARSDSYWKNRLIEEVEKGFDAGRDYGYASNFGPVPTRDPNKSEYITELKEKYK